MPDYTDWRHRRKRNCIIWLIFIALVIYLYANPAVRLLIQGLLTDPIVFGLLFTGVCVAYIFWPEKKDTKS